MSDSTPPSPDSATGPETPLAGGGRTNVTRRGAVVHRETGPWAATVHLLLRHLERVGFAGAPRVVGTGFDARGRETLTYIDGEFVHPGPWGDDALPIIGHLLRELHDATATFAAPGEATWRPWFGRALGDARKVIGHCDAAPWNIVAREGVPVALIDWEVAGPVDPAFELAQACWLNAQLYDDDVAERVGLPPLATRARQMCALLDGYGCPRRERPGFVDKVIEFAVHDAAEQVIEAQVTRESEGPGPLWAVAYRTRSAAWMLRNRPMLEGAIMR